MKFQACHKSGDADEGPLKPRCFGRNPESSFDPPNRAETESFDAEITALKPNVCRYEVQLSLGSGYLKREPCTQQVEDWTGLTSSSLVMIKTHMRPPNLTWQMRWLHLRNHHSVPRRLETVYKGWSIKDTAAAPTGLPVPVTRVIVTGVSHRKKVIIDVQISFWLFYEDLRGKIIRSQKAKRFITFPPHCAEQTYRGDNVNQW